MAARQFHPSWSGTALEVLERAISRHGGWSTWERLRSVTLEPRSLSGMVPAVKGGGRTFPLPSRVVVTPRLMEAEFRDYPTPGNRGRYARGELQLVDAHGVTTAQAADHRSTFHGLRKYRRWSPLDALYFFGYALTHYHSLPFSLGEGQCLKLHRARLGGEPLDAVTVEHPSSLHTHCRQQTFYFDGQGVLRRHDYVAEIVGAGAHGAHFWEDYEETNGLLIARRRHVLVRLGRQPLPFVALHAEFGTAAVELEEQSLGISMGEAGEPL
jgi:hypothetical protein